MIGQSAAEIREHAAGYVPAAWRVRPPGVVIDLGSGAGVPGIHLAHWLNVTRVVLVDSSARRCELAGRAVSAVGLDDRVTIIHSPADELAREVYWRESADGVVARLFGPPAELAECGLGLVAVGGRLVVSVNDETRQWWCNAPLAELGAVFQADWTTAHGAFVAIQRVGPFPSELPRRPARRRRRPWPES